MKVEIKKTEDGELFFEIPEKYQQELQWEEGDLIEWIDNQDGSWTAKKLKPLQQLKEKAFKNPEVKIEYDKTSYNITNENTSKLKDKFERIYSEIQKLIDEGMNEDDAAKIILTKEYKE